MIAGFVLALHIWQKVAGYSSGSLGIVAVRGLNGFIPEAGLSFL
jgi:hypothetical protein